MSTPKPPILKDLPLKVIHIELKSRSLSTSVEDQQLIDSIKNLGILVPILVMEQKDNSYKIIDGHRRYLAAEHVGLNEIPCLIRQKLTRRELEKLRWDMHNT